MKIKTKKQMTAEEYAKYMIDKYGIRGYENSLIDTDITGAPYRFTQTFELKPISKKDLPRGSFRNGELTVEVEEEITEDTVIPKMLLRGRYTGYYEVEDCKLRGFNENLLQAYIINDDLTMTLIWCDGKLVE